LAVKYIPADAVSKIEVLEKYNEVSILKGNDTNDRLALNIKLKEHKKKFIFGDVSLGTNLDKRHHLHSNIFYYSPKLTINNINDYNTTEEAALSSAEMFRIVGLQLDNYDPKSRFGGFEELNRIRELIIPSNIFDQQSLFGVAQIKKRLENNITFDAILLGLNKNEVAKKTTINTFIDRASGSERNEQSSSLSLHTNYAKFNFSTDPKKKYVLAYSFQYSNLPIQNIDSSRTSFLSESNFIKQELYKENRTLNHEVRWIQQWNKKIQTISQVKFNQTQYKINQQWGVNGKQIPTLYSTNLNSFLLTQNLQNPNDKYNLLWKINYAVNQFSKAFLFVKYEYVQHDAIDSASIENGGIRTSLSNSGIGYTQNFSTTYFLLGSRFLTQKNNFEIKTGLDYFIVRWKEKLLYTEKNDNKLTPFIDISKQIYGIGKLKFNYEYDIVLPMNDQFHANYFIKEFNKFRQGNTFLRNEQIHRIGVNLSKSSLLKGRNFFINLVYNHTINALMSGLSIQENNIIESVFNIKNAKNDFIFSSGIQKVKRDNRIFNNFRVMNSRFIQVINDSEVFINQYSFQNDFNLSKDWRKQEISLNLSISCRNIPANQGNDAWVFQNVVSANYKQYYGKRWNSEIFVSFNQLDAETFQQNTLNISSNINFSSKSEKYNWSLRGYNLLDQNFIGENYVNNFFSRSAKSSIIPRLLIFSFTYVF
ncbi:MAG: hypothetical protein ACK4TA_18215, partial [Saprospiraceae bacterium]